MRILCAALSGAGFLLPIVAIASELRGRGHQVEFVTDVSRGAQLAEYGFTRIPRTQRDGASFGVATWFEPLHVALQVAHLRYAVQCFKPDIIVSSHLTLGAMAISAVRRIPIAFVGPVVYLFPLTGDEQLVVDDEPARVAQWRLNDLRSHYHRACREIGVPPDDSTILGDRYLVQGIAQLDPAVVARLPANVRQVGACVLDSPRVDMRDVESWLVAQRAAGRSVAFVQLGRMFGVGDPWPLITAWAKTENVALVASLERYDAALGAFDANILVRNGIALERIVPQADLVICSGMPSPLLAAALAGKPALIARCGSGTEEHAATFERYGSALAFNAATIDPERFATLARRLRCEPSFAGRARALRTAFGAVHGPSRGADEIEMLAGVAA
jgi:UDP:flavonoid glycosyltransferase YjiC (YdhE family)